MPNSPDPLFSEDEAENQAVDPSMETNSEYKARMSTTVGELRRHHGLHFAPGYGDTDTLGHLLARAGCNTLDEYLTRHRTNS